MCCFLITPNRKYLQRKSEKKKVAEFPRAWIDIKFPVNLYPRKTV